MISLQVPGTVSSDLYAFLVEVLRRAVDGTLSSFFMNSIWNRIGINTATPEYTLDVNGDVRVRGRLIFDKGVCFGVFNAQNIDAKQLGANTLTAQKTFFGNVDGYGAIYLPNLSTSSSTTDDTARLIGFMAQI